MAPTLEVFKKTFAGKLSPDVVPQRDKQVTAALKEYGQAVGSAALDPTKAKGSKDRLTGLVQRFEKFKKSNHPAKEALTELDDILKNARAGIGELKQSVPAGPPPSLPGRSKAIPTDRFQLMFEKKQLEDKLGKNSYIGEDEDRARLEHINIALDMLGPVPTPPPQPKVDNRPTAGELVARDKKAALEKRAYELGYAGGLIGDASNVATMLQWDEVKENPPVYSTLQEPYLNGFKAALPKRQDELAQAHKAYKATRKIPATKYPFMKIEIREGRMMNRAERMDAMLKAQGKPLPTMDSIGFGEVDEDYLTIKEFKEEVLEAANVEKDQCEKDHTFRGPTNKCKGNVNDKYGGPGFQDWERKEAQRKYQEIKAVADRIEDVKNAGPVKLVGKAVGRGTGYLIGGDEGAEIGDEIGGIVGGVGDVVVVKKAADVAKTRNANYGKSPPKPPPGGTDIVNVATVKGSVEMSRTQVAVEQAKAQQWLAEQKAADAKKPAQQQRSDAQLIKQAREQFNIERGWEPFAPHERQVTVNTTTRGQEKMTVEEYRRRVDEAQKWVDRQKMVTENGIQKESDAVLVKKAAGQFGLDEGWASISNANYYGPRVTAAPPKGAAVNFNYVRQMKTGNHGDVKVVESASPQAHEKGWRDLGHQDAVPPAYMVDNTIHVDMKQWPKDLPRDWNPR